MKKASAITAGSARTRRNQQQACVPMRYLIRASILVILFCGLLLSHGFLYCRTGIAGRPHPRASLNPSVGGFRFPDVEEISNETVVMYSQFNPAAVVERNRFKFLLEATQFGKISIKEALKPRETRVWATRRPVVRDRANSWTLPFISRRAEEYVPQFLKLSKRWLGDDGDSNPGIIRQDRVETAKKPRYQNLAYWSINARPDEEDTFKGNNRYQTCAVVGNSGILLNGSHGKEIDRHEMVMRLNNARVVNYTTQVGSKTSLSFMNGNVLQSCSQRANCNCHRYGHEVPIVLYICQAVNLLHVAKCTSKQRKPPLLVTHSLFDALCAAVVKWYSVTNFLQTTGRPLPEWDSAHDELQFHYSSGVQAVVLALGICDSVDLYGFGKFANATHHYHTKQKGELSLHDYAAEYLFYDDLVHNRTIPFLSDSGIFLPPVRIFY